MTLVSPLLIVLFYGIIFYFSFNKDLAEEQKQIIVADQSGIFKDAIDDTKIIHFTYTGDPTHNAAALLEETKAYAVLSISGDSSAIKYNLLAHEQPGLNTLATIESKLENVLKNKRMHDNGVNSQLLDELNNISVKVNTQKVTADGVEKGSSGGATAIGLIGSVLIYFFIFIYGVQIMKGVIEEKTNRIVEVLISSVKPFQLMMGKILGIAMVGFTQFIIWVALVSVLSGPVSALVMDLTGTNAAAITEQAAQMKSAGAAPAQQAPTPNMLEALSNFNLPLILGMFVFYFIGGYLFYGALFAAVGSAVDSETDTQQFMMPITLPLIFSIAIAQSVINAPNSNLAIWLSMIPFSSPVIMMVRLPFGVPLTEIIASMTCMIAGFIATVWFAGRIYRIGILTYGKKPSYKELFKWLFLKN